MTRRATRTHSSPNRCEARPQATADGGAPPPPACLMIARGTRQRNDRVRTTSSISDWPVSACPKLPHERCDSDQTDRTARGERRTPAGRADPGRAEHRPPRAHRCLPVRRGPCTARRHGQRGQHHRLPASGGSVSGTADHTPTRLTTASSAAQRPSGCVGVDRSASISATAATHHGHTLGVAPATQHGAGERGHAQRVATDRLGAQLLRPRGPPDRRRGRGRRAPGGSARPSAPTALRRRRSCRPCGGPAPSRRPRR